MKFSLAKGPYLRSKRSTTGIMIELFAVLSVVWITSIVAYSIRFNFTVGLRGLLVGLVSLVTTIAIDVIMALVYKERTFKGICKFVLNSYSYVTALIFALCLPIGVNLYVVVIGAIVATLLGKYAFGGFGYNIFNPAIIGRIFVGLSFPNMMNYGIVSNSTGSTYDFVTGSTVTGSVDWSNGLIPNGYDLKQLLFGNYNGAMGETFTILLVVAAIYLIIRGIVNYRLIGSYLLTITGIGFFLGLFYKVNNPFMYTLVHLITGGLMFGAVFMITDPVTSPKSMNGKIIFGICAAGLTMLIRVKSSYPEGVMFSIALMNMFNPLIDSCIKGNTFSKQGVRWAIIAAFFVGVIGINVGFNALYPLKTSDDSKENANEWLKDYTITKKSENVYEVESKAFHGNLTMEVTLDTTNNKVTKVEVTSVNEHENNYNGIEALQYYNIYIGDNLNLSFSEFDNFKCSNRQCIKVTTNDTSFDIEAGSTWTSSAIIGNIKAVIETYKGGAN